MKVTIDIPDSIEQALHDQFGPALGLAAKEALAVAWYQSEKLSIGQVAELLGISVYDAQGFMKERRIATTYTVDDLQRDRDTLDGLLKS